MICQACVKTLTEHFLKRNGYSGRIHSQFRQAVNILLDDYDSLFTILPQGTPAVPDSLIINTAAFSRLALCRCDEEIIFSDNSLQMSGLTIDYGKTRNQNCRLTAGFRESGCRIIGSYRGEISGLAHLNEGRRRLVEEKLRNLAKSHGFREVLPVIGYGDGLTPATDDAIVGILLVLQSLGVSYESFDGAEMKGLTTDVSLKYLINALRGNFSQRLLGLLEEDEVRLRQNISLLKEVGSSSGNDMLQGVIIALDNNYLRQE